MPQSITYKLQGTYSRNFDLEEYFGLVSNGMNSKYRNFIMPQMTIEGNQFRVQKFTQWRDWYTYHWQMSRILDIVPELAKDSDYVRDWNEMRSKVVKTFYSDFDNNEQQYILQSIHLQHLFEPSYDKLKDLRGDKDAAPEMIQEAQRVSNIFLKQYGFDFSDVKMKLVNESSSTGAHLLDNNNNNSNSSSSSNRNNSNSNSNSSRDGRFASRGIESLTNYKNDEERRERVQSELLSRARMDKDLENALNEHYEETAYKKSVRFGMDSYAESYMKCDLNEDDLFEKMKQARLGPEFDTFMKEHRAEEEQMRSLKHLNEQYAKQQQQIMTRVNKNRRKKLEIRQKMERKVPEMTVLEASDIKKYSNKLSIEETRRQTIGAATQMDRQQSRVAKEVQVETQLRDKTHHSSKGLQNYNQIKQKMETDTKHTPRVLGANEEGRHKSQVRIGAPKLTVSANEADSSQEEMFKQEMEQLQRREKQMGLNTNKLNTGTVMIKPPQVQPVRPVPPTVGDEKKQQTDTEMKDKLINLINSDNILKKQKAGMVVERHQSVKTPLKQEDPAQLRTVNQVLKNLGTEDLNKINEILGTAGASLGQNGVIAATVGPTQKQQRIKPPKVGNEMGQQQQQQQQQAVQGVVNLVPNNNNNGGNGNQRQGVAGGQQVCANVVGTNPVCANVVGNLSGAAGGNGAPANMTSSVFLLFSFVLLFVCVFFFRVTLFGSVCL